MVERVITSIPIIQLLLQDPQNHFMTLGDRSSVYAELIRRVKPTDEFLQQG